METIKVESDLLRLVVQIASEVDSFVTIGS
jgi:hypothetical protein